MDTFCPEALIEFKSQELAHKFESLEGEHRIDLDQLSAL